MHAKTLEKQVGPTSQSTQGAHGTASLHPGNVDTGLIKKSWGSSIGNVIILFGGFIKPKEGAYTSLFAAASDKIEMKDSGAYWVPFATKKVPSKQAMDSVLAEKLWEWTEKEMRKKGLIE